MTRVQELAIIIVLAVVGVATLIDIAFDLSYGSTVSHITIEIFMVVVSFSGVFWLLSHVRAQNRALEQIKQEIADEKKSKPLDGAEGHEHREKLSEIIRQQFERWQLTSGEQVVALLLLKGLSFKVIAGVLETLE